MTLNAEIIADKLNYRDTVFFDMGDVLAPDVWEDLIFKHGLVDPGEWTEQTMAACISPVWKKYSILLDGREDDFWNEVSDTTGLAIDQTLLEKSRKLLRANPDTSDVFEALRSMGKKIGIISDNTNFFYPQQVDLLDGIIEEYVEPSLNFLSHRAGIGKKNGLLDIVATQVDPNKAAFLDDRQPNIDAAASLGFLGIRYHIDDPLAAAFDN